MLILDARIQRLLWSVPARAETANAAASRWRSVPCDSSRHLHQVNAPPQEPCEEAGDLDAENLRDCGTVPSEPSVPRPSKANCRAITASNRAAMLMAAVVASRIACCAVGGTFIPATVLMEAQSPSAQTCPSYPFNSRPVLTKQLSTFLGAIQFLTTGGGADGTVEISVLQGISIPDPNMALSDVADHKAVLEDDFNPAFPQDLLGKM